MVASQLQVSPESFNISPDGPEDGQIVAWKNVPTGKSEHLESALPPALARRVVEKTLSLRQTECYRLSIENGGEPIFLDLPLSYDPAADSDLLVRTPEEMQGVEFVLNARPNGPATVKLDVRYVGLPVDKALSYTRFLHALFRENGTLYLARLEPAEAKFELLKLPVPLSRVKKSEVEDKLIFLEALDEITTATGSEFVYPEKIEDEDVRNINHILKAIRSGWVAQRVTDFATPLTAEGIRNLLKLVGREGEARRAFYQENGFEVRKIFDAQIALGPSRWYVSGARLRTTEAEMREWLASEPKQGDSFEVRWAPVDDVLAHFFYPEWPKPSLAVVHRNLRAFEDEYGMSSDEFRRAWRIGDPKAHNIEEGDIWISFLDAQDMSGQDD